MIVNDIAGVCYSGPRLVPKVGAKSRVLSRENETIIEWGTMVFHLFQSLKFWNMAVSQSMQGSELTVSRRYPNSLRR